MRRAIAFRGYWITVFPLHEGLSPRPRFRGKRPESGLRWWRVRRINFLPPEHKLQHNVSFTWLRTFHFSSLRFPAAFFFFLQHVSQANKMRGPKVLQGKLVAFRWIVNRKKKTWHSRKIPEAWGKGGKLCQPFLIIIQFLFRKFSTLPHRFLVTFFRCYFIFVGVSQASLSPKLLLCLQTACSLVCARVCACVCGAFNEPRPPPEKLRRNAHKIWPQTLHT